MKTRKISPRLIAHIAVLTALQIVLTYLVSINTPIMRIGFGFVPVAVTAILYGPGWAIAVSVISDILGSTLFSSGWFPPLTITAVCVALTYGLLLNHKHNPGLIRTTIAAAIYNFILSLFLQTYLLTFLMDKGFEALFATRLPQAAIMFAIQVVILPVLVKLSNTLDKQFHLYESPSKA